MPSTEQLTARMQIDLPEDKLRQLESLMKDAGIRTKKEFVNNALTLLAWAIRETKAGRVIAAVDENDHKYKEILLPALENIAASRAMR